MQLASVSKLLTCSARRRLTGLMENETDFINFGNRKWLQDGSLP